MTKKLKKIFKELIKNEKEHRKTMEDFFKNLKKIKSIFCPNCNRKMPNDNFRRGKGCKWCIQKKGNKK